jgi:hypothetical protein
MYLVLRTVIGKKTADGRPQTAVKLQPDVTNSTLNGR